MGSLEAGGDVAEEVGGRVARVVDVARVRRDVRNLELLVANEREHVANDLHGRLGLELGARFGEQLELHGARRTARLAHVLILVLNSTRHSRFTLRPDSQSEVNAL